MKNMIKFTSAKRYDNFKDRLRSNGINLYEKKTRQNYVIYKLEHTIKDDMKVKTKKTYIAKIKRHIYDKYKAEKRKKLHEEFKFLYQIHNTGGNFTHLYLPLLPTNNM